MAIRYRDGRKAPWIVYWKNPFTGKTEEEAFSTDAAAKKANSLIKHRLKYERETFRPESETEQISGDSLQACYYLYLKEKKFEKSSLRWSMESMKKALELYADTPIHAVTRPEIERLKSVLTATGVKPVTVRSRLSVLRAVLRWCAEKGILEQAPLFPKLPPARYEHFIPPTPQEIAALCNVAPPHLIRVILLGSQLGVRIGRSELLKIKWDDIDLYKGVARIRAAKKRPDQPWREVPIRDSLLSVMRDWKAEDDRLNAEYVINFKGKKIGSIQRSWATALRNAGITRRIRPYDLRHAFATEAIAAGYDVGTVAQIMGHDPKMLLDHYQHVADSRKRAVVEGLPEIPNYGTNLRQNKKGNEDSS